MKRTDARLRLSARRAGPLLAAVLLGAALIASSAQSYRDARDAAAWVAERQGIALLHRVERQLQASPGGDPPPRASLSAALESGRALGLTYIGVLDGRGVALVEAGDPVLRGRHPAPAIGAPTFGEGRVRMVGPRAGASRDGLPGGPRPYTSGPDSNPSLAGPRIEIEFEPIGSEQTLRRALTVLVLSTGTAGLLSAAALVFWTGARRAERDELQRAGQRHLARLGEMSAVLAHEIRNPLASLKGHAQLLAERVDDPALAGRIERVVVEALRLEHLTNDLLDFARTGALELGPTEPGALLDRAAEATSPGRIERTTAEAPSFWSLDANRVEQVLINLLENALAVTPEGLKVEARIAVDRGALVYTVRDHGPGVPPAERTRIFEPFHTTKLRGTGLGLSVAKRLVELHGGALEIVDAPGGGAEFRVRLPVPGARLAATGAGPGGRRP